MTDDLAIDDLVDELSREEHLLVMFRAAKALDYNVEWVPDDEEEGTHRIQFISDEHNDLDEIVMTEEFLDELETQYANLILPRIFRDMASKGAIAASGVNADGEIVYEVV